MSVPTRALQVVSNLPCPVLPGQGRVGQVTRVTGQGRARLLDFLQGRLQAIMVITCQPVVEISTPTYTEDFRNKIKYVDADQTI
jgi:hypothetical protein